MQPASKPAGDWPRQGARVMCGNGMATSTSDGWVHRYHQWGSLVHWEGTQVNSTGVPWAMYWDLYIIQECAQTKLCYEWQPMANEELGKGLPAMNSKRGAYHDKASPAQLPGCRV